MLERERERGAESNRKLLHLFIAGKSTALVPEFAVEDMPSAELQPWFLCLQWRTCPWAEHSDEDYDYYSSTFQWHKHITFTINTIPMHIYVHFHYNYYMKCSKNTYLLHGTTALEELWQPHIFSSIHAYKLFLKASRISRVIGILERIGYNLINSKESIKVITTRIK